MDLFLAGGKHPTGGPGRRGLVLVRRAVAGGSTRSQPRCSRGSLCTDTSSTKPNEASFRQLKYCWGQQPVSRELVLKCFEQGWVSVVLYMKMAQAGVRPARLAVRPPCFVTELTG